MMRMRRGRAYVDDADPLDMDDIAEIHGDSFARGWSADELAALLANPGVFSLVLRRAPPISRRRIDGFVLARGAADEAEILSIAVAQEARRRGHGRRLMEETLRRLYRDGFVSTFLEVDDGNAAAIGLYRDLGFGIVGGRDGYYPVADAPPRRALVMRLQLR